MISMLNCYRNQPAFNCLEIGFDHIHTGLVQERGDGDGEIYRRGGRRDRHRDGTRFLWAYYDGPY